MSAVLELEYTEGGGPGIVELPADVQFGGEPAPDDQQALPGEYPGWEQETVEQFLMGLGAGVHMMIGAAEKDWLMTQRDLERIAPPMTRIANRWEPALRLSPFADPLLVAHGFALYGWRSALERSRALRDQAAEEAPETAAAGYVRTDDDEDEPEPAFQAVQPYFQDGARPRS